MKEPRNAILVVLAFVTINLLLVALGLWKLVEMFL